MSNGRAHDDAKSQASRESARADEALALPAQFPPSVRAVVVSLAGVDLPLAVFRLEVVDTLAGELTVVGFQVRIAGEPVAYRATLADANDLARSLAELRTRERKLPSPRQLPPQARR